MISLYPCNIQRISCWRFSISAVLHWRGRADDDDVLKSFFIFVSAFHLQLYRLGKWFSRLDVAECAEKCVLIPRRFHKPRGLVLCGTFQRFSAATKILKEMGQLPVKSTNFLLGTSLNWKDLANRLNTIQRHTFSRGLLEQQLKFRTTLKPDLGWLSLAKYRCLNCQWLK